MHLSITTASGRICIRATGCLWEAQHMAVGFHFIQIIIPQKMKQDETEARFLRILPVSTKQPESFREIKKGLRLSLLIITKQ